MKKTISLNNNHSMPVLGLGTWKAEKDEITKCVAYALTTAKYKHIDCASIYGNEKEIGKAFNTVFSSGTVKREKVFVTSKLWNTDHDPKHVEAACRKTLKDLQLDYLDLYLMHWGVAFVHGEGLKPIGKDGFMKLAPISIQQTWKAMERLVEKGLVKSIGVANFTPPMLLDLLTYAKIKPALNQIEIHPYNTQEEFVAFCHKKGIAVTAYSPLGSWGTDQKKPIQDEIILKIAKAHQKTPAQIIIRWIVQRGLITIPKSTKFERIAENKQVEDFELSLEEMKQINSLNKNQRFVTANPTWGIPFFK